MTATLSDVYEFDVGVSTHDLLKIGVLVHHYRRVRVSAHTLDESCRPSACFASDEELVLASLRHTW